MRCRSRSCSQDSSENEHFYTPGYGLKNRGHYPYNVSAESGIFSGPYNRSESAKNRLVGYIYDILPDDMKGPVDEMMKKWKKPLFSTSPAKKNFFSMQPQDLLTFCVLLITLGSAVFSLLILANGLNRDQTVRNGKYDSIDYAHKQFQKKGSFPYAIVDEFGNPLGGKKAAIQFAYDRKYKNFEDNNPVLNDDEILERLTLKAADNAMKILEDWKKEEASKEARKRDVIQKLKEFGHFGTTVVKPLDIDGEIEGNDESKDKKEDSKIVEPLQGTEEVEDVDKSKEGNTESVLEKEEQQPQEQVRQKRDTKDMSMKENPFSVEKVSVVKREDDPFRFVKSEDDPFRFVKSEDDPFRFQ